MCDYSLMAFPNRLANCGEELVVHRFQSGSVGLAAASALCKNNESSGSELLGFWARFVKWFTPPAAQNCTAVCVPPGARLLVYDFAESEQQRMGLSGSVQEAVFTEIGTTGYRDAIRLANGAELLLQKMKQGQRVRVMWLSSESEGSYPEFAANDLPETTAD